MNETRIDLSGSDFPASYVFTADGDDVRVFQGDDQTPVDFVVTGWDSLARTATIYLQMPIIAVGTSETVSIYLGDNDLASGSNANLVFPSLGMRLHSRSTSADPVSAASGLSAFQAAAIDVDNSIRTTISGLNNRSLGGANSNYAWCVSAVLNVTPATAGTWGFRYGGDFGRGGHLYVRGQALEEDWNDNLWWAGSYANTGETLEGTINLPVGWHRYEALGFEDCCDGPTGFQARAPGGSWQDLSSSNFSLRASQCIIATATVSVATPQSCSANLSLTKTSMVDVSSSSSLSVPGSTIKYILQIANPGQTVDAGTLILTDIFPSEVSVKVSGPGAFEFTDGAIPSGLGYSYDGPSDMTDSVEFSTDGIDFSYTPIGPYDDNISHIRFRPTGDMNPNNSGDIPSFSIQFLTQIK